MIVRIGIAIKRNYYENQESRGDDIFDCFDRAFKVKKSLLHTGQGRDIDQGQRKLLLQRKRYFYLDIS